MQAARAMLRVPEHTRVREIAFERAPGEPVGSVELGVHGELAVYGPSGGLQALACALLRAADAADRLVSNGEPAAGVVVRS